MNWDDSMREARSVQAMEDARLRSAFEEAERRRGCMWGLAVLSMSGLIGVGILVGAWYWMGR